MTVVVDASVAVPSLFGVGDLARSEAALRHERLIAPDLIMAEIASAGWKLVRFGGFNRDAAKIVVEHAGRFIDELVPSADLTSRAFEIGLDLQHPVYDCLYLALSESRGLPLVSFDEKFRRRCAGTRYAGLFQIEDR